MKTAPANYKPYPSDVSDEEWSFVAPYLTSSRLDGEDRKHDLRAIFNALRVIPANEQDRGLHLRADRDWGETAQVVA